MLTKQNWGQLSTIQIGGVICMPVFMIGQTLYQLYGFSTSIIAVIVGNFVLFSLGLISAKMSVEGRKTTMENAIDYFGEEGVKCFSLAFALSLVGWFAIQLNMMTLGVMDLFSLDANSISIQTSLNVALGLVMTFFALYGVRGISILANISLPLLLATIAYAAYTVERAPGAETAFEKFPLSFGGVSLVIAMAIGFIIDLPTYFRHATTARAAYISIILVFGLCLPALEIIGVYLASAITEGTFLEIFKRNNSAMWNIWTATFLVLAGWTTNNVNLYSGVICLETLTKKYPNYLLTLAFGIFSTALSCVNLLNHLDVFLEMMGIIISSMGGVIFARYLLIQFTQIGIIKEDHFLHLIAWSIGIVIGLVSWLGLSFTGISVLDATFGASLGVVLVMARRLSYEKAYSE